MHRVKAVKLTVEYQTNPIGLDIAKPRISWQIESDGRGVLQTAYQIQVYHDNAAADEPVWDTGKVESGQSVHVEYAGAGLQARSRYDYRVKIWDNRGCESEWSQPAFWETGLMSCEAWQAEWIAPAFPENGHEPTPADLLRKTFEVSKPVRTARVYATALGLYELHVNGSRAGDILFAPGWTSYEHRLQYQAYDITALLRQGGNAIGVMLGDGWYKGYIGWRRWKKKRNHYGDRRAALVQVHIAYEDGSEQTLLSDTTWKQTTGAVLMSENYHGELYDARLEKEGWSEAACDDSGWKDVERLAYTKSIIVPQENVPTRIVNEIKPVRLFTTPAGETVLDMGQNMVGWMQFRVSGPAGSKVVLYHAEVLDKEGNIYLGNLRGARQTVEYLCKGGGEESYEPHFTFMGFRYVHLVEYPGTPKPEDFTGKVIHSDMEPTGTFECSDTLINQLQHNILWGQKGNFLDVPTDCPQRDERMGWTGDAQVFIRTAAFNMQVAPFFTKWLRDLAAEQLPDGGVPSYIPNTDNDARSSAAWGDAATICPWTVYLCYGDTRLLAEQYASMKAWVEYIRAQGDNEYLWNTGFHFGDWLALDAKENSYTGSTPKDYIATAFYAYSTELLLKAAEVLDKREDAEHYRKLHTEVVQAFRHEFVTPSGRLASPTQTAHVLALMFGLLEGEAKKRAARTLAEMVQRSKYHLTTGFVGTPYLCLVLSDNGYHETAAKLVQQRDYPSWLYSVTKGATTIWEHWDGIKQDGSFWSDNMNSFNHYAYGSVGDWLYRKVAGIDLDETAPGYRKIRLAPAPGYGFTYAKASLLCMYGEIRSAWEMSEDGRVKIEVAVPANTTAVLTLPGALPGELTEQGKPVHGMEGIEAAETTEDGMSLSLASGSYSFSYLVRPAASLAVTQ